MEKDNDTNFIGRSVPRLEDERLLRGKGCFVDDIHLPGMLHAALYRSPVAHARLTELDISGAAGCSGVRGVFTYKDIRSLLTCERIPLAVPAKGIRFEVDPYPLVKDEIHYVGEPIVVVVAESRRAAEDAAEQITIGYEELPPVVDPRLGLAPDAHPARLDCPDNLVAETRIRFGDMDAAFGKAKHRFSERFRLHKGGGHAIEPRGVVAHYDVVQELLTMWDATQMPHRVKSVLVKALGLVEHQVRVIAPDVGGGFGPKGTFHQEEMLIPAITMALGFPIKWIEDRYENLITCCMEREQEWDVEAAFSDEGRLLGIRGTIYHDHGAHTPYGIATPYNAGTNLIGPYVLPCYDLEIKLCLTNMVPTVPTRGAGRPQGTFVMERFLDLIADRLGVGRDEVRRRNFIAPSQLPFEYPVPQRDGTPMVYDTGDYPECQRRALERAGWSDFARRQEQARAEGRLIGLGVSNYVEATGRGPYESGAVRIGASGKVVVTTGATNQGQGTETMLAQIAADALQVPIADIRVIDGDTAASPLGLGAYASRQAVTAGNAVHRAATLVANKAREAAAEILNASTQDIEISRGVFRDKRDPGRTCTLSDIAKVLSGVPGFALPGNMSPGLAAAVDFQPVGMAYSNGSHVAEVEVDADTGLIKLTRYIVVHDCGRLINPAGVDGQVLGGVVHGIGATLFEWMRYDENAQPMTVTLADYLLPTADVVPRIEIEHMESPTPQNPLGVKGAGEAGTIGVPAAIVSAVENAIRPLDIFVRDLPLTPERLRGLIMKSNRLGKTS